MDTDERQLPAYGGPADGGVILVPASMPDDAFVEVEGCVYQLHIEGAESPHLCYQPQIPREIFE